MSYTDAHKALDMRSRILAAEEKLRMFLAFLAAPADKLDPFDLAWRETECAQDVRRDLTKELVAAEADLRSRLQTREAHAIEREQIEERWRQQHGSDWWTVIYGRGRDYP